MLVNGRPLCSDGYGWPSADGPAAAITVGCSGPSCPLEHRFASRQVRQFAGRRPANRSEEHTSELQSLMRISYAVFCLKKKNNRQTPRQRYKDNKWNDNSQRTNITKRDESHIIHRR